MTVAERVARGVAKMDQHYPGWWRKIDCGRLDLSDYRNCVLCQLEGGKFGFLDGLHKIGIRTLDGEPWDSGFAGLDDVDAEWKRVIAHRLAEDAMAELNAAPETVEV